MLINDGEVCVIRAGGVASAGATFVGLAGVALEPVAVDLEFADSEVADLAAAAFDRADVDLEFADSEVTGLAAAAFDPDVDLEFADSEVAGLADMDLEPVILVFAALESGLEALANAGVGALALPRGADGLWS